MDITDGEAVTQAFANINETFGQIDVLMNNAEISEADKPTHKMTESDRENVGNRRSERSF